MHMKLVGLKFDHDAGGSRISPPETVWPNRDKVVLF